jgi:hypothetical protein
VASKAQRAVTDVPPERWAQFGKALQAWREDELGYQARVGLARDSDVNIRLLQDLEKNYRPGTYTKWALQDAARAYQVPYCPRSPDHPEGGPGSILAFLRGEEDTLARARAAPAPVKQPAVVDVLDLPPAPFDDPAREAADRPYAMAIWRRFLDLPRRVTEPAGVQMFPEAPDDAQAWDGIGARLDVGDRVWFIADLRRRADPRAAGRDGSSGTGAAGA